jgi:hypothetical protein
MRYFIFIAFAVILVGCASSSFDHPAFVTTFGRHTSSDGNWRIMAAEGSLDISHPSKSQRGDWVTHSPDNWNAQTGWFVYIEGPTSVWAYDGDGRLVLEELTGVEDYSSMREMLFQREIPAAVFSRLSDKTKGMIDYLKKRPNTALEPTGVGAGSSASRSTSQPADGSAFGR